MSSEYQPPAHHGLDILHQDESLLVLNKPSGLLSVPGRGADKQDSLATRVQAEYSDALIVHRLDMETSGLLVMARGKAMHRQLSMLFQDRRVEKCYQARVAGELRQPEGEIDLPLITDWPNRPRQKVDWELGKPSLTRYQMLAFDPASHTSRVALMPVTGRSHQLRVHMLALGHPILGDRLYAPDEVVAMSPRLCLHAEVLEFSHPASGEKMILRAPLPF